MKKSRQEIKAYELSEKIEKIFKNFGINISIPDWEFEKDRIQFKIKLKGGTREKDVRAHAQDVQSRLKLPLFQVFEEKFTLYIVTSDQKVEYPRLPKVLDKYSAKLEKMDLPYVVGHDIMGQLMAVDLSAFPHLLLGGSTNSGKSVGLRALIATTIKIRSPSEVNLILVDVGAGDLMAFNEIPHLSCPVVQDHDTAYQAITALKAEMERRIKLEHTNQAGFKGLPKLLLVIDEFPALFSGGLDKNMSKELISSISSLLQRGRHAKIHLVLAAQNPTFRSMKVDLGNITGRIAFKCAKKNFSETILDEGGAENLQGPGCLLLKSPQNNCPQWIQGIYVKSKDIQEIVEELNSPHHIYAEEQKFHLTFSTESLTGNSENLCPSLGKVTVAKIPSEQDLLLASIIFWAFGLDQISTNMLMTQYHLGWNRATSFIKQLEAIGIVGELHGKCARSVRLKYISELPNELVKFMERCDYPYDSLICRLQERVFSTEANSSAIQNCIGSA